jgi:ParB family transcriptional regulator, chromosome partitioning protein
MAQWWKPTVPGYLGRVPKLLVLEAVTKAKGANAAENIAALKKGRDGEPRRRPSHRHRLPPMLRAA